MVIELNGKFENLDYIVEEYYSSLRQKILDDRFEEIEKIKKQDKVRQKMDELISQSIEKENLERDVLLADQVRNILNVMYSEETNKSINEVGIRYDELLFKHEKEEIIVRKLIADCDTYEQAIQVLKNYRIMSENGVIFQ